MIWWIIPLALAGLYLRGSVASVFFIYYIFGRYGGGAFKKIDYLVIFLFWWGFWVYIYLVRTGDCG